jgi:2-methylcitrate dehydratase PrpD
MNVTERLCRKITEFDSSRLSEAEYAVARQLVLDGIAVAVAGANMEEAPRILAEYFRDQGGSGTSSLLGLGFELPIAQAALVNGASMHVLDFEPMWLPGTHALSPALATVLALAEPYRVSGRELATALMKGVEMQTRLRAGYSSVESHNLKFHPPGVVGPFGATVAAAHILGFDAAQLANALGIAASRCGSLFSNLGTMTKSSHCGYAAALGLEAALLAARGFTGTVSVFDDGPQSFSRAFMPPDFDPEALLAFGEPFRAIDPGYAIKLFPAKFSTHYGISAALALRPAVPSPGDIKAVRVVAAEVPSSNRPSPKSGLDGKFSVQYTVAAALLDGYVGLQTFTDERLFSLDMQALLPKIDFRMLSGMPSTYNAGRFAEVEIDLADGSLLMERCERPRGSWGAPPASEDERLAKARSCLAVFLPPAEVARCIALATGIDQLGADEVAELIRVASGTEKTMPKLRAGAI